MKVVRSVDRAVAILFHVADCECPLGLSEISRLTGFDKATCLRLMNTLEMHGLICQEAHSRHYKLGPGVSRLTYGFSTDLRYLAPPLLRQLWLEAKESICLNCKRDLARMVVDVLPAARLNRKTLLSLASIVKAIVDQLGNLIDYEAQVV